MKKLIKILSLMPLLCCFSCTEDVVIDLEEGSPMIVVEGSITDQMKQHEVILSYTANFYHSGDIEMVCGAKVCVTDGVDTIRFQEDAEKKGHYFSEMVAGRRNTLYRLMVDVPDETEEDGFVHLFAESFMKNNVDVIDSIAIKPFNGVNDTTPAVIFGDTIEWLYPYFQSLPDPSIVYMPMIWKNDTLLTDTLTQRMLIPIAGYAGYYVNGPEMLQKNKEIPIHYFMRSKLHNGDRIRADLQSVPMDFMYYVYSLSTSLGSNPMMGAPTNLITNIQPAGKAVGWFYAASVASAETVFQE